MKVAIIVLIALLQLIGSSARFSVGFHSGSGQPSVRLLNAGASFTSTPSAEQLGDIYARLGGLPPLLWEDEVNLPAADNVNGLPLLLEVSGGVFPAGVATVITSSDVNLGNVPSVDQVVAYLHENGINCEGKNIKMGDLSSYLEQSRPVVVFHSSEDNMDRVLQDILSSNTTTNTPPISEFEISQYQICMWTGIVFVLLVLASICGMANMDVTPDNLLFAKFQSGRTEKRD